MALDPSAILNEVDPENQPADAPPPEADYRDADLHGVSCASCVKFTHTGFREFGSLDDDEVTDENRGALVPIGYCGQWEAKVDGLKVSNAYAHDSEPMVNRDGSPNEDSEWNWTEFSAGDEQVEYHEIHLSDGAPTIEKDGKILKGILRTGKWDTTPTPLGKLNKPLEIVRDGKSDIANGIISMQDLIDRSKTGPIKRPMIPLSDKSRDDHVSDNNLTRVNTGFIEDLFIEDDEDGVSHLMGEFGFTEPDVREKVLRGTYADVSAGLPIMAGDDGVPAPILEHVCITNTPFIDGLKGYLTASDATPGEIPDNVEIHHHHIPAAAAVADPPPAEKLTDEQIKELQEDFTRRFNVVPDLYDLIAQDDGTFVITNKATATSWTVPYEDNDGLEVAAFDKWTALDQAVTVPSDVEMEDTGLPEFPHSGDHELDNARFNRELRSQHIDQQNEQKERRMPLTEEQMTALGFTPEQRAAVADVITENQTLAASSREASVDARVEELKSIGLSGQPGFLKLYRTVALADDQAPAAILFSDDGSSAKEKVTATQILDKAIDALTVEGKITLSGQALDTGATKPPEGTVTKSDAERADDMRESLGLPRLAKA